MDDGIAPRNPQLTFCAPGRGLLGRHWFPEWGDLHGGSRPGLTEMLLFLGNRVEAWIMGSQVRLATPGLLLHSP